MATNVDEHVHALVKKRAYAEALSVCNDALLSASEDEKPAVLRLRGYVHGCTKNHEAEVADLSAALAAAPDDTRILFDRSRCLVELHRFGDALADLQKLVEQEERRGSVWYLSIARLLQVVCLIHECRAQEAVDLCAQLDADATGWVLGKLQKRNELLREASAMLKGG